MKLKGINSADSCYKEPVQFGAVFVGSLPVFDEICGMAMNSILLPAR